jgi:hypothetical protein
MTKCRVCGNEHSGGCAQFFASASRATRRKVEPPAAKPVVDVANVANTAVANKDVERVKRWRVANREKYNARERERMRARRAAGRVSG